MSNVKSSLMNGHTVPCISSKLSRCRQFVIFVFFFLNCLCIARQYSLRFAVRQMYIRRRRGSLTRLFFTRQIFRPLDCQKQHCAYTSCGPCSTRSTWTSDQSKTRANFKLISQCTRFCRIAESVAFMSNCTESRADLMRHCPQTADCPEG